MKLCIKNEELCIKSNELCINMMDFAGDPPGHIGWRLEGCKLEGEKAIL